jgi:hypothetical protein
VGYGGYVSSGCDFKDATRQVSDSIGDAGPCPTDPKAFCSDYAKDPNQTILSAREAWAAATCGPLQTSVASTGRPTYKAECCKGYTEPNWVPPELPEVRAGVQGGRGLAYP